MQDSEPLDADSSARASVPSSAPALEHEGAQSADWPYIAAAFITCVLSVFLRFGEIPHTEPIAFHPDEPDFVVRALRMVASGHLNPGWFGHPGSLTLYNLSLVYAIHAALGGTPHEQLLAEYARDPAPFHVLGKYLFVFWSLVTHLGLWLLARHFMTRWPALLAVLLLATSKLDISIATLIRTDTQQSAFLVFVLLFAVRGVETSARRWFVASGLALGFACAVKWPSVAACPAIAMAGLLTVRSRPLRESWRKPVALVGMAALASVVGLFLAAPYVFLDFATVLRDVAHEARARDLGPSHEGVLAALGFYLRLLLRDGSVAGMLLAALGAGLALRSRDWPKTLVTLSLLSVYLLFISLQTVHWPRWGVPLLPSVCLLTALGVERTLSLVRKRTERPLLLIALGALLGLLLCIPAATHVTELLERRARGDAGVAASHWIAEHVPARSKVLGERAAPMLPSGLYELYVAPRSSGKLERVKPRSRYFTPTGQVGYLKDVKAALAKVDYVVLGNYHQRIKAKPAGHGRELRVYEEVFRKSRTVFERDSYRVLEVKKDER